MSANSETRTQTDILFAPATEGSLRPAKRPFPSPTFTGVDLGQVEAWAPSNERGPWGWCLWWAGWVLEVPGWIVAALFAAAVTGIIRRDDD